MRTITLATAAAGLFIHTLPAMAATTASDPMIVQISVSTAVTQTINYAGPTPNYRDPNPYLDNPYVFWDQYQTTMWDIAEVWDRSQIPTSLSASDDDYYNVVSHGMLEATWTFDASLLARDLAGLTDPDGTLLGQSALVSTFSIVSLGREVVDVALPISQIYVADNMAAGAGGERLDVIAIAATNDSMVLDSTDISWTADGVLLYLAGDSNWFEEAAGEIPDFSGVVVSFVEYIEDVFDGPIADDLRLYTETISADLSGADLSVRVFGAADGSSEATPILPEAVAFTEDGAPVYGFDISVAGADFVFIDPEIAVGYTYEVTGGGAITAIQAPSLGAVADADGYVITLPDGTSFTLLAGEAVTLDDSVTRFTLSGIDPALMLDPADQTTFVIGLMFEGLTGASRLTQTALVVNTDLPAVPLPAAMPLLLAALGGLGALARRRRAG